MISPTVTRRPALDAMLGDIAYIAKANLEAMRTRAMSGHQLDEAEIKDFRHYCEITLKQARLEMAVEIHVEQRTGRMDSEAIATGVVQSLADLLPKFHLRDGAVEEITKAVLVELGLDE
jgi:hypothetical protein